MCHFIDIKFDKKLCCCLSVFQQQQQQQKWKRKMLRSHMQFISFTPCDILCLARINLKRSTTERRPRLTNKPSARMVRNSMTTMFDYNNVKSVENHELQSVPYSGERPSSIHTVDRLTIRFDIDILRIFMCVSSLWCCVYMFMFICTIFTVKCVCAHVRWLCVCWFLVLYTMIVGWEMCSYFSHWNVSLNNNNKWNHMNAFAPPTMASVIGVRCPYFIPLQKYKKRNRTHKKTNKKNEQNL